MDAALPTGSHMHRQRGMLERLGTTCARHPAAAIIVWLALLAGALAGSKVAGGTYSDNVNLAGTQASVGATLLSGHDKAASGYSGLVVLSSSATPLSADASVISDAASGIGKLGHVLSVSDPLDTTPPAVSPNGRIGYLDVHLDANPKTLGASYLSQLEAATSPLRRAGLEVEYGGDFDQLTRPKATDTSSEVIGLAVALLVLLVGFGSIAGAFLPLAAALLAVLVGTSLLSLMSALLTFGTASPTLALMIGLGVGIDYAVFLTTRFRQRVADGVALDIAVGSTAATSGHAVLVAATTVSVALIGLYASGITFLGQLGLAAVFSVSTAGGAAITLVPAALGLAGRRIDRYHLRQPVAETGSDGDFWHRYATSIGKRPWWFLVAGVVVLGVLAIPLFSIRLGHVDDGADPTSYTDKRAYDLIARGFGPGANGPLTIVVKLSPSSNAGRLASSVQQQLSSTPDVAKASPLSPAGDHALLVGTVVPQSDPQSVATTTLYNRLVATTLPQALRGSGADGYVTGTTAANIQFAEILAGRLAIVIGVVVLTAFLLIAMTFRSLLLALKAAVLNLVSISAAYGVVVAVFQWGWGRSLIGVSQNVPIESYVPMMMFAIVFGLSMDYEVFLLSRVKESWDLTGDHRRAVAQGLSGTARVITCAALIMISVFISFVDSSDVVIKMLAVGLAFSVLIDATVVRLLLVPAVMDLIGQRCWWIPHWLDRLLPKLSAEGNDPLAEPGSRPRPQGGAGDQPSSASSA